MLRHARDNARIQRASSRSGGMVDAAVSKTVEGQLSCRFESDLRHHDRIAELCSGSTEDFGSFSPGSNPGSAASNIFRRLEE